MKKAIILLSGGMDSLVGAAIAKDWGYELYGLCFDYGQRHLSEIGYAKQIAKNYCKDFKVIYVPKIYPKEYNYFPARNTIFLSFGLSYAETIGATEIFIGCNADDYNNFPDCRPEYFEAFQSMASLATKGDIKISTHLINMSKIDIVQTGNFLNVDFLNTMTCYNGNHCGQCASCKLRRSAFLEAGINDPIKYKS
jgi:7-cyano-7-deazaguanine synthase